MIKVGWTVPKVEGKVDLYNLHFKPVKLSSLLFNQNRANKCPAIRESYKNTYVIFAPFDVLLKTDGQELSGLPDGMDFDAYSSLITMDLGGYRFEDKPIAQIDLNLCFISDDKDVVMTYAPAYMHYNEWPGVMVSGKYDIYDWPARNLTFAFEFHKLNEPLMIKRGTPIAYVSFNKPVELVECKYTNTIKRLTESSVSSTRMTKDFKKIMKYFGINRRPKKLIEEV